MHRHCIFCRNEHAMNNYNQTFRQHSTKFCWWVELSLSDIHLGISKSHAKTFNNCFVFFLIVGQCLRGPPLTCNATLYNKHTHTLYGYGCGNITPIQWRMGKVTWYEMCVRAFYRRRCVFVCLFFFPPILLIVRNTSECCICQQFVLGYQWLQTFSYVLDMCVHQELFGFYVRTFHGSFWLSLSMMCFFCVECPCCWSP